MKTIFYIDGYNLYYSLIYGTPYKWLNLLALAEHLMPGHEVVKVKYFTSKIKRRLSDPQQPQRQAAFLRATATLSQVEIIEGHYSSKERNMPLAQKNVDGSRTVVRVIRDCEKASDVNLAAHLLKDAFDKQYEFPSVITNDEDLGTPLSMVRNMGYPLALFTPSEYQNNKLKAVATYCSHVRLSDLSRCQLPITVKDDRGREIHKPHAWR